MSRIIARLPIALHGVIAINDKLEVTIVVLRDDWEFAPFNESGESDAIVVEFDRGSGTTEREYDANIVVPIQKYIQERINTGEPPVPWELENE